MVSLAVQVATGMLCASYWRGAWYVLDHTLYPDDRMKSATASLASGAALLGAHQYLLSPSYNGTKWLVRMLPPPKSVSLRTRYIQTNRFIVLYGIASACILIWRGTWLLWDEGAHVAADAFSSYQDRAQRLVTSDVNGAMVVQKQRQLPINSGAATIKLQQQQLPLPIAASPISHDVQHHHHIDHHGESTVTDHEDVDENVLFYSGIASHVVATAGLLLIGRFAAVMAPPANVCMLRDRFLHGRGKEFARAARSFAHSP